MHMGKDLMEVRSSQRKLVPDSVGSGKLEPTFTASNSLQVKKLVTVLICADASTTEEPDAGKLHVRVCAGGAG